MMDAPLSSPSLTAQSQQHPGFNNSYFSNSTSSSSASSQSSSSGPTSAARQTHTQTQAYHHHNHQQPPAAAPQTTHQQQIPAAPANKASHFLQDFSLVAEAAKRAQMAVLMRDLEAVDL